MADTLPDSMKAIEITQFGPPEVLSVATRPIPQPNNGELLVRVAAAGVNNVDRLQRTGVYVPPAGTSDIPGVEFSGVVVAIGPGTDRFKIGDKVCAVVRGGAYAEFVTVHETNALPVPFGISLIDAGGIAEAYFTVWMNLIENGQVAKGQTVLVHGGSSGIGSAAIQLANARGAKVWATAGSREKCDFCERLGAHRGINYLEDDFVKVVKDETSGRGVDIVVDIVGGPYVERNYDVAADKGKIIQVGFMAGQLAQVNMMTMIIKRLAHLGASLRPQTVETKAGIARELEREVWPLFSNGKLRTVTDRTFPLGDVVEAHRLLESSKHIGKILLTP